MRYSIDDNNTTARLVRKLRTEKGMSQQQLAVLAGVSFSFVNQVERGKPTLRLDAVNKILSVFGYTMTPTRTHSAHSQVTKPAVAQAAGSQQDENMPPTSRPKNDWAFFK